jgi:two-component system nitrate/nitrite response regulator NarL
MTIVSSFLATGFLNLIPMDRLRLLLADDHIDVLNNLSIRLEREPDLEVVGLAVNSGQAIALSVSQQPDAVIIDPMMRDGGGFEALKQINRQCPSSKIVVLTAIADTAMLLELGKIGVSRILTKEMDSGQLIQTLSRLCKELH